MSIQLSGVENIDFRDELTLLEGLKRRNVHAFIRLYREYSEDLLVLAFTLTDDPILSSQAVDMLFTDLWEKGSFTDIAPPIHHFLYSELRQYCKK